MTFDLDVNKRSNSLNIFMKWNAKLVILYNAENLNVNLENIPQNHQFKYSTLSWTYAGLSISFNWNDYTKQFSSK